MKNIIRIFTVASIIAYSQNAIMAQEAHTDIEDETSLSARFDESVPQRIMPTRFGGRSRQWREDALDRQIIRGEQQHEDSLNLPRMNQYGQPETIGYYPLAFAGWDNWGLHRGLNVQIGASVFAQFGKGAHSGAGFQQNIAMMYAMPVTDKLSVAVGGYLNNINYVGDNWRDAGLSAVIGYRFNEHWEAYVYGQKSISNNMANRLRYSMYDGYCGSFGGFSHNFFGMPSYSVYDLANMGDRIGATVRYNFNNNMSIQVSVENRWLPTRGY